jgi:hypothetical protein
MMPASMRFRRQPHVPWDLLLRSSLDKVHATTHYVADFIEWRYNTHYYSSQHVKVVNHNMKAHYDHPAKFMGLREGEIVWLYHPT